MLIPLFQGAIALLLVAGGIKIYNSSVVTIKDLAKMAGKAIASNAGNRFLIAETYSLLRSKLIDATQTEDKTAIQDLENLAKSAMCVTGVYNTQTGEVSDITAVSKCDDKTMALLKQHRGVIVISQ